MASSAVVAPCPGGCAQTCAELAQVQRYASEAMLAEAVYKPFGQRSVPGFEEVTDPPELDRIGLDRSMLDPTDSKFRAGVFREVGTGNYHVAYKGTNSFADWMQNLRQGVGADAEYYRRAQDVARQIGDKVGRADASGNVVVSNVSFVGHSLGGGLASAAARATGLPAVTFNSAGLHPSTVRSPVMSAPIEAVRVRGEILTAVQSTLPIPEAVSSGAPYLLDPPSTVGSALSYIEINALDALALTSPWGAALKVGGKLIKGAAARATDLHGMNRVRESLAERQSQLVASAARQGCSC